MDRYNHRDVEKKWQSYWREHQSYAVSDQQDGKENYYQLVEFPYPSGNLHVGHWYAFAVPDIRARYLRARGKNVLFPIGFDAFGLPAENAAIKHGINPRTWTYENMDYMRTQIDSMGTSFDRSREVVTCDPEYYRWTQWIFLELYKNNLVNYSTTEANWCPKCKTVLANEQVIDGHCERCDSVVEKKQMKQWQFRITEYADRLIDDLDDLDWPEEIKASQKNWIGRSEGAEIDFSIVGSERKITVFTTRPDTLYGVTYMVLAPEHQLVTELAEMISNADAVEEYKKVSAKKSEIERTNNTKEKTGVRLEGVEAINPISGEKIPVFVADYVLAGYGTGAVMAVPAHDERDHAFARKYNLPIREVIEGNVAHADVNSGVGRLCNSGDCDGMDSQAAKVVLTEKAGGRMTKTYRLRDWGVSRQRYWGVPIPMIHCDDPACGTVPVPEDQLPVVLPDVEDYLPNDEGQSPLSKKEDFVKVPCPQCGKDAKRETDTLDTFVCSSWYFLRYSDPRNETAFASEDKIKNWMPVDHYSGGSEHTTMHVLYSRFIHKALYDLGHVTTPEPYRVRMNRSLILGPDGNKMSKSKGNIIDPDSIVESLGADTMRLYLAFIGPFNSVSAYPWNPESIIGVRKFIERVWKLGAKVEKSHDDTKEADKALHACLKGVTESIDALKCNTGVAALMTCVNVLEKQQQLSVAQYGMLAQMMAPYAPHIAQEMWSEVCEEEGVISDVTWPALEEGLLMEDQIELVIQVNGKVRDKVMVDVGQADDVLERIARDSEKIKKHIEGKEVRKVIVIKGRMVNIVAV